MNATLESYLKLEELKVFNVYERENKINDKLEWVKCQRIVFNYKPTYYVKIKLSAKFSNLQNPITLTLLEFDTNVRELIDRKQYRFSNVLQESFDIVDYKTVNYIIKVDQS